MSGPFQTKTAKKYDAGCNACACRGQIPDRLVHARVLGCLWYGKRKGGGRGRVLRHDLPELGLLAGDRLEPLPALPDISAFDRMQAFPTELTFWHPASETIARHRNPLFCADVGAGIYCTTMRSASSCRRLPSGRRARVHGERERAHAWKQ